MLGITPGINLLLQTKQTQVTGLMRTKTRNFDIITQQIRVSGNLVVFSGEELFLIIKTRSPGQIGPYLQILTQNVP